MCLHPESSDDTNHILISGNFWATWPDHLWSSVIKSPPECQHVQLYILELCIFSSRPQLCQCPPPTYHLITRHCEFPSQLKHLDHWFKLLVSQMKNVCYLVISRHRGVQLLPRPTPLLLTNPGHLLHPLHTSLVCSALTFLPDISSHLSACHGFPPIARNPSLFPLSHFTFPTTLNQNLFTPLTSGGDGQLSR